MSQIKWFKYALASAAILVVCAGFALAADDPVVATVNGQPYSNVQDAFSAARSGDRVDIVSDCTIDSLITTRSGLTVYIPSSVTVELDSVGFNLSSSTMNVYGRIVRTGASDYGAVAVQGTSTLNLYGGIMSANAANYGIFCSTTSPGVVNIYGGHVSGFNTAIGTTLSWPGKVYVYGGTFSPSLTPSSQIVLANGANFVPGFDNTAVSWGGLYEVGQLVLSACQWIGLLCASIVANKLLLIFLLVVFSALGIGLIKRVVR